MDCRNSCVSGCGQAGKMPEQEKLEARKMLENRAESHTSGARFVRRLLLILDSLHNVVLE
jgi:iron only hydrogenase large subunit-like protein